VTGGAFRLSLRGIDGTSYTLDNAGNRTAKTDQRAAVTTNYGYDSIYQLLSAVQGSTTTESYAYDPVGNRTASLGVSSYTTNASNELTATSNASYTYDSNGNMLTKTVGSNTTSYTWDIENRLTSVTLPGSGGTVTFKYDPYGRRIQKAFTQGSTTTTTNYVYDGADFTANVIEEVDNAGNVLARYVHDLNFDGALSMLRSGVTSFFERDGLDSVTSLTNSSGTVTDSYTFDSFGKMTASSGTTINPIQYIGNESDQETGLYLERARYYDPSIGRFVSEDPLEFLGGGPNFYAYVGNDATNLIDPLGLTDCVVTAVGPVCSNWGPTGWSWLEPHNEPRLPLIPDEMLPTCGCNEIKKINKESSQEFWKTIQNEAVGTTITEAAKHWGLKWFAPIIEKWDVIATAHLEYELWKIEHDREVKISRVQKACGAGFPQI
jgi:RHS repeat-associated protein